MVNLFRSDWLRCVQPIFDIMYISCLASRSSAGTAAEARGCSSLGQVLGLGAVWGGSGCSRAVQHSTVLCCAVPCCTHRAVLHTPCRAAHTPCRAILCCTVLRRAAPSPAPEAQTATCNAEKEFNEKFPVIGWCENYFPQNVLEILCLCDSTGLEQG